MTPNTQPIIIKKYANRRLYNTATSAYITLEDLANMIHEGIDFSVRDAKTDEDLTQSILIQIIADMEETKHNLLPVGFLRHLIKLYDDNLKVVVPSYLDHAMAHFTANQDQMRDYMRSTLNLFSPGAGMAEIGKIQDQNRAMVANALKFFPFSPFSSSPTPLDTEEDPLDNIQDQLEKLQEQLEAIRNKK